MCYFSNCDREVEAKGYCHAHYMQLWRGEELKELRPTVRRSMPLAERLARRSERQGDCIVWMGARNQYGYGVLSYQGKNILAHRAAYELERGPLVNNALHHCDNPPCINVEHLYDGDQRDNLRDAVERGRV